MEIILEASLIKMETHCVILSEGAGVMHIEYLFEYSF